jgi:hypothetical protein
MLIHCVDESAWSDPATPRPAGLPTYADWFREMDGRGVLLHGHRLRDVSDATSVQIRDRELLVSDGPFAETKEQIGGLAIIKADSKQHAIELVQHFLGVAGDGECELRQLYEAGQLAQSGGR